MKGKKRISREDRNDWNNLVKFANNLPLSYFMVTYCKNII